jgi:N-acetylneuraminic acid mutarotase
MVRLQASVAVALGVAAGARADMLYAVGGEYTAKGATSDVETFQADTEPLADAVWKLSMDLPSERLYHQGATVNEEMYILGGRGDANQGGNHDDLASVLRFDALEGEWYDMAPMSHGRVYLGVAADDEADLIYAAGGIDDNNAYLVDAECYDTRTDTWRSLPDMNHARNAPATVVVDSVLWVIGGYDGNNEYRDTVEWFDVQTDEISCRTDPDCVEQLEDWFQENGSGRHDGAEWTDGQHPTGTRNTALDPNLIGGRRRSQQLICPPELLTQGVNQVSTVCEGNNGAPTGCMEDCAAVFVPWWTACGETVGAMLPNVAQMLQPLVGMCANPTHGFDETAEEAGPPLVVRPPSACPPEPTCPVGGAQHPCGDLWDAYHICQRDQQNGDFDGRDERPHICGDDCDGNWHMLDERMLSRRAYACAVAYDNDADGDEEIFVLGGKAGNQVMLRTAEVFDIDRREWSALPDMATERWGLVRESTVVEIERTQEESRLFHRAHVSNHADFAQTG